jgi:hypothetical protein
MNASLETALETRFFSHVESLGFIRDKRQEPRMVCYRRRTETAMQIFAVLSATRGRPGFWLQFAEAPLNGIDYSGKHLAAEEIFPGNFALLRGWLIPKTGERWFRLSSLWYRLISRQRNEASALVQRLLDIFPEVIAWWENKTKSAHLIVQQPAQPSVSPSHASVSGYSVKPSLWQRFFARDAVWPIGFLGTAVAVDLAFAVQAPDLKKMLGLVFVGAVIGLIVSWIFFKILWRVRVWLNRGPFHTGDLVQVIAGPHAGKIAAVYDEWPSRKQVRIDLGETESTEVKDVYSYVQLLKSESTRDEEKSKSFSSAGTKV